MPLHEDRRVIFQTAQLGAQGKTVQARQHDIEQDKVGFFG